MLVDDGAVLEEDAELRDVHRLQLRAAPIGLVQRSVEVEDGPPAKWEDCKNVLSVSVKLDKSKQIMTLPEANELAISCALALILLFSGGAMT